MQSSSVLLITGCSAVFVLISDRLECLLRQIITASSPNPIISMQPTVPITTVTAILIQIGSCFPGKKANILLLATTFQVTYLHSAVRVSRLLHWGILEVTSLQFDLTLHELE